MASANLLVDLGANVFKPTASNIWERFEEYCVAYIYENVALIAEVSRMLTSEYDEGLLRQMTDGQRHLYVLGSFDSEVNNGGVYQFFFNVPHLAHEVARSLESCKLRTCTRCTQLCSRLRSAMCTFSPKRRESAVRSSGRRALAHQLNGRMQHTKTGA